MDFFHQLIQQLINGVSLGSIYALIALGYTMIYGRTVIFIWSARTWDFSA